MPEAAALQQVREMVPTVSVGMLTANLLALGDELALLERTGVKLVHVDVMDGCFCPMMTVGPPFVKALRTPLLKDVHLMIVDPLEKVQEFVAAGADIVTIHSEACAHPHRVLQALGGMANANDPSRGLIRGVALNPGTPLDVLPPLLDELELVLLLAVNPGWGGQKFIPATKARAAQVRKMLQDSGRNILLGVDGAITRHNVTEVAACGADVVVTGSAVFDGKAAESNARFMLEAVKREARSQESEFRR